MKDQTLYKKPFGIIKRSVATITNMLFMTSMLLWAQGEEKIDISIDMDVAQFQASDDWTLVEIYYSFPRESLKYTQVGDKYQAVYSAAINLFLDDSLLTNKGRKETDSVDSLSQIRKGQLLTNLASFYLKPGVFKGQVKITDLNQMIGSRLEKMIEVQSFSDDSLEISDIELSIQIKADSRKGKFVKNGYRIIPNPKRTYGLELPILYYYCELYNFSDVMQGQDSTYSVKLWVLDEEGKTVYNAPLKTRKKLGKSLVDIGKLNVASLRSGFYHLHLQVTDNTNGHSREKVKDFSIYHSSDFITNGGEEQKENDTFTSEFADMDEEGLNAHFENTRYISTSDERKLFKGLDLEGKRKFMAEFWEKRDTNPLTSENEYKTVYLQRVAYANQRFSQGKRKGWQTDQGRILITYGQPDKVDTFPSSMGKKSYEIWYYYEIEGSSEFVFVDLSNIGTYRIVHSSVRDEVHDRQWRRLLY